MSKRLRGWELEKESGIRPVKVTRQPLEKGEQTQSVLASKLLHLWSTGVLSAVLVQSIADLAMQDGASHPELVKLASTGHWGAQSGNCHRQILNRFCPEVHLAEPFKVKVKCIDPKTSLEKEEQAFCFLPHLIFSSLGESYPEFFHEVFSLGKGSLGKGDLEKFWTGVEKVGDDRIKNHPMCLEKHWKEKTIPLFVHGDGVEYHNRDTLLVYSWGGMLKDMGSLQQHNLLACYPKSCTTAATWEPIWKWLKWSFEAFGKGKHPTHDPDGNPLEKGSIFLEKKGKPLLGKGYRAVVWSLIGDHEYYANVLKLPHWASHHPCWECDAQNYEGAALGKGYKHICLEKQKFVVKTHEQHLANPQSPHPLFQLPGVSTKNVRGDPMHILFSKGLYGHLLGSILHYSCYWEGPGRIAAKRPWERLGMIFQEIQQEYKSQGLANRLTNLKLSMITDQSKPWANKANLDCKAGESKHLLPALVPVLEKIFEGTMLPEEQQMITAAKSLEKLVQLWDEADIFLTAGEYAKAKALGKGFLDSYKWLHEWSLEKGRNSFHVVAKHHTFIHLLWNSKYLNPRKHWCFKGENFVGHISKMAHSVSFGVSSTRLTQKIFPKYRILLHFQLTRNSMQQVVDQEDPWDWD